MRAVAGMASMSSQLKEAGILSWIGKYKEITFNCLRVEIALSSRSLRKRHRSINPKWTSCT
jgi:hypothetical protein